MAVDLSSIQLSKQVGHAVRVIAIERAFQEARWKGGTAANPSIKLSRKMSWFTEEFMEAVTAFNDYVNSIEDGLVGDHIHGARCYDAFAKPGFQDPDCGPAREQRREIMHEVAQAVAVGQAILEAYLHSDPTFDEYVRRVRQEKLNSLSG